MNGSAPETAVRSAGSESRGELPAVLIRALLWIIPSGLCAAYGYYTIFSRFHSYDDEGFILISLKWFFAGHALYDQVYSCYQPGFYVLHWLIFKICGAPLGHDSIRMLTLAFWLGGAGLNGLTTYRLTRNKVLSLLVFLLSARCLDAFANEPGHPQALAYLLVAGLTALFTFADILSRRILSVAAGATIGLLLLIKINVGVFALAAVLFVWAVGQEGKGRFWLRAVAGGAMATIPAALMHSRLTVNIAPAPVLWGLAILVPLLILSALLKQRRLFYLAIIGCVAFAFTLPSIDARLPASLPFYSLCLLTLSLCALAAMSLAHGGQASNRQLSSIWLAVGIAGSASILLLIVLFRGTSLRGLLNGMWLIPAAQSQSFFVPWQASSLGAWFGLAGVLCCVLYLRSRAGGPGLIGKSLVLPGQLAFGLLVLAEFFVRAPGSRPLMPLDYRLPHFWMLPFAWLALAGLSRTDMLPHIRLGRLALASVVVVQPLIAYPVAGTQLIPASMLLAILAAVCLEDVWTRLAPVLSYNVFEKIRPVLSAALMALFVLLFARETLAKQQAYAALAPLQLPGAKRVRLSADEVRTFQDLVRPLARPEVGTFLTLPGLNSLYFWAGKEAPTGLNTTTWMTLLDATAQEKIWEAARERPGLMAVRNRALMRYWLRGRSGKEAPLVRHIDDGFQTVITNGSYELMIRR